MAVTPRLNRLFSADGKCLDVALDLGLFNEYGFLSGLESMDNAVRKVIQAAPDAIQLSPGQAKWLQNEPQNRKPSLVLRVDASNVYGQDPYRFSQLVENPIEQAVAWDAACVVVNLFSLPGQAEFLHQCVNNLSSLKPSCERYGMPLMVEAVAMKVNERQDGIVADGDFRKIAPLVRLAAELGADIIKTSACDELGQFHRVVEAASGLPVLPLGGSKASEEEVLRRTRCLMDQGSSGAVYGRNVIQHPAPDRMTRALMAIVHEDASVDAAMKILQ